MQFSSSIGGREKERESKQEKEEQLDSILPIIAHQLIAFKGFRDPIFQLEGGT